MAYRLYFVQKYPLKVVRSITLQSRSDDEAIAAASTHLADGQMELWCEGRFVQRFDSRVR